MKRPALDYAALPDVPVSQMTPAEQLITKVAWISDNAAYGTLEATKLLIDDIRAGSFTGATPRPSARPEALRKTPPNGLWVVWYEDPAQQHEVFFGEGAEVAARARFKQAEDNWSCHLLSRVCTPVYGSCSLPSGHHGQHEASVPSPRGTITQAVSERESELEAFVKECIAELGRGYVEAMFKKVAGLRAREPQGESK